VKPASVLVIDDNAELADNLRDTLTDVEGYDVECLIATSSQEAVAHAKHRGDALDLALLDLRLPDGDGLGLIASIRSASPFAEIIIITGEASVESAAAAVGKRVFAYVVKPFTTADLLGTAERALSQAQLFREHAQLRTDLERSERRYRGVVEAIPALVMALDPAGRIVLWNRQLELVTGFPRAEMLGKSGARLVGTQGDWTLPTKHGGHRLVSWKQSDVDDTQDGVTRYYMGLDVTDEREMLRRTLRAERLAAVGTLAAGLAHEVRNPLNSAMLQLQVLRRRVERGNLDAASLTAIVQVVEDEIRRLDRLVTDFLAFARPAPLELRSVNLAELVTSVAELMRAEATAQNVTLEARVDRSDACVEAEPERLRQVMLNLMRNAIEAMPRGGTLTVRTRAADQHGNVGVEVEDTGPGFPEDAPIFDAFYTTKEQGTGLGLAITHRVIADHGGSLRVESRPGRTLFHVLLPQRPSGLPAVSQSAGI
jgi:signal transduction histidine kinase